MNKRTARAIHAATNMTFWAERPDWNPGGALGEIACKTIRLLPFSIHNAQKWLFFGPNNVIAVNGESVVVANDTTLVDKFMFRYPDGMTTQSFFCGVEHEVRAVVKALAGIALDTQVSIKPADIFRFSRKPVSAVVQTQKKLDLGVHAPLSLATLNDQTHSAKLDKTAADIERMLEGIEILTTHHGYYPDIAYSSGNLRRNEIDGAITLMDVMPIHSDGSRLIEDGAIILPNTLQAIGDLQAFVGQYGS